MTSTDPRSASILPSDPIRALGQHTAVHRLESNGVSVCWRRFGQGFPLVLLHGGHGSWLHWSRNVEALATRFSVLVPDMPGYGDSDVPAAPTLDALLDALLGTLDHLIDRNTPFGLAGFSFGGLVAAHIAARRPQVRRLALLGSAGHDGPRRPRAVLQNWRNAVDDEQLRATMRHNLAAHMLHADAAIDELALAVHIASCQRTRFRSKEISRGGGLRETLGRCQAEVLLLWGEHDVTADPTFLCTSLTDDAPARHAGIVAGAGHWVQYERPDEVNRLLLGWFRPPG